MSIANRLLRYILNSTACLVLPLSACNATPSITDIKSAWKQVRATQYISPDHSALTESRKLFSRLLNGDDSQQVLASLEKINFRLDRYSDVAGDLIIVREKLAPYQGLGMFIMRSNGNGIMLQAPHAFKDLHTGKLAIKLMQETNYSALVINTVPRRYESEGKKIESDMAHMYNSHFISFSRAFITRYPDGKIVQLHGFNSDTRDTRESTKNTSMIISAGVKVSNREVLQEVRCLRQAIKPEVMAYPDDISLLGGTTNSIGRDVRALGFSGFRHYEMNLPSRKNLLSKKKLRTALSECIVDARR